MADFTFVTSNPHKVATAKAICQEFGLEFDHLNIDMTEIQADNGQAIAKNKAEQAFAKVNRPMAVTDDSWMIPGLRGFPGPYMRYINQWLTPEDFLNLTRDLKDRRIMMRHIVAYQDSKQSQVFSVDVEGILLKEARGQSVIPHFAIISFDGGQHSVAEAETDGPTFLSKLPNAWHQFGEWFTNQ